MDSRSVLTAAAVMVGTTLLFTGASQANTQTFNFTSDHCNGGCLTGQTSGGTVTVTDAGTGVVDVTVSLANGNQFVNTGFDASFGFNLSGISSITYSAIVPLGNATNTVVPGFFPTGTGGTLTQATGALHMDGTGTFQFGLEAGGNPSTPDGSVLSFVITGTGLSTASFTANSPQGQLFAADILSGTTGLTGGIDVSAVPAPILGAGIPGLIAACGALLGLARRRRQQGQVA